MSENELGKPRTRGSWLDVYAGREIAMTVKMTLMSQRGSAPHFALKLLGPLRHARRGIHLPAPIPLRSLQLLKARFGPRSTSTEGTVTHSLAFENVSSMKSLGLDLIYKYGATA